MTTLSGFDSATAPWVSATDATMPTRLRFHTIAVAPSSVSDEPPRGNETFELPDCPIEGEPREPEHEQAHDHDVAQKKLAGVPDHPAETGGCRYDFGRNQHRVGEAETDAHAGANAGQAGRKKHVPEELHAGAAEHLRGPHMSDVDRARGLHGTDGERRQSSQKQKRNL